MAFKLNFDDFRVGFWKPKMFLATFDNLELPKSRAPPLNSSLSFVAPQAWEIFEGLWEITFLCENAFTNMIFRDLETIFLHQTTEHIRKTCTPDLKFQSGFFQTEEHASSTSNRGLNQNYYVLLLVLAVENVIEIRCFFAYRIEHSPWRRGLVHGWYTKHKVS